MNAFPQIQLMIKMLKSLDHWLGKAAEYAAARPFDVEVLVQSRLAPDQYPLVRQVQAACDTPKFAAAYLSTKAPPSHPDTETTFAQLRQRVATAVEHLETYTAADFDGALERRIAPKMFQGKALSGGDYLLHLALPNFFFHITTAYSILRHSGVQIGKTDYIGGLPFLQD